MKNMGFISVVKGLLKAQSLKPQGLNLVKKGSFNEAFLRHAFMALFEEAQSMPRHAFLFLFLLKKI